MLYMPAVLLCYVFVMLGIVQHRAVCKMCIDMTTNVFNSYDLTSSEEERDAVRVQKRYMSSANII